MEELISVIVPVCNTDIDELNVCLTSLKNQTYANIEVLCVDASTNVEVEKVIDNYLEDVRFIKIKDFSNISAGRNIGINSSHGDYIIFIDSDDYCDLNFLLYLYRGIKESEADVAIPMTHRCVYSKMHLISETPYEIEEVNDVITKHNYFKYHRKSELVEVRKLYKMSLIKGTFFDVNCPYGEDLMFNYELSKKGFKTCLVPKAIYYYRVIYNANSGERRFNTKGWLFVKILASIIRSKEVIHKEAIDGLYDEFDRNFNIFYYALARNKRIFKLFYMIQFKPLYLKRHHRIKDIFYMLFPIFVVYHRNKKKK